MLQKPRIHFIHIFEAQNSGEILCGPYDYFPEFSENFICLQHDIRTLKLEEIRNDDWVILGGGGLFEVREDFQQTINAILRRTYKVVSWSCGHNHHESRIINEKIDYSRFLYLTVRDYNFGGEEYCPCCSCMNPLLDLELPIVRKFGIVEHLDYTIDEFDFAKIKNSFSPRTVLSFISQCECVITNSYHATYWATLMKKKVIVYKPFSTKFDFFKFKPVFYSGDLEKDFATAKNYFSALEECRELNIKFAQKIFAAVNKIENK